jgi:hypothetical protein
MIFSDGGQLGRFILKVLGGISLTANGIMYCRLTTSERGTYFCDATCKMRLAIKLYGNEAPALYL